MDKPKRDICAAPVMPWSPLDSLIDALPAVRAAGRVVAGDDVMSVQKRIAGVFLPIVKKIQDAAYARAIEDAARKIERGGVGADFTMSVAEMCKIGAAAIRALAPEGGEKLEILENSNE